MSVDLATRTEATSPSPSRSRALKFIIIFLILLLVWAAIFWFTIEPHPTAPKPVTPTKTTQSKVPTTPSQPPTHHVNYPTPAPSKNNAAPGLFPEHPNHGGYFQYDLSPGQSAQATVILSNKTKSAGTYLVYPTIGITSDLTGLQYQQPEPGGSANWVNMKPHLVSLKPGGSTPITVPITVPRGVKPGEYVDAIVGQGPPSASNQSTTHKGTTASILVTNRTVIAIVVDVPGPTNTTTIVASKPTLTEQDGVRQVLNFPLKETGNQLGALSIDASIKACGSSTSKFSVNKNLSVFVPFTQITYPVYLNNTVLGAGCYVFSGKVSNRALDGGAPTSTVPFRYTFNVSSASTHVTPSKLLPTSTQTALNSLHAIERDVVGGIGVLIAAALAWIASRDWKRKKNTEPALG